MRRLLALALLAGCVAVEPEPEPDIEPTPEPEAPPSGPYLPEAYDDGPAERLLFLGDSITNGAGAGNGLKYRQLLVTNADDAWPDMAGSDLSTAWFEDLEVLNVAQGGATSRLLVERQLEDLEEQLGPGPHDGATASVFTIGGNDAQFALAAFLAQGIEEAEERVDLLMDNLDVAIDHLTDPALFPDGARVYLANIYEPTDGVGIHPDCFGGLDLTEMMTLLDDANARIRQLAVDRGVAMIDLRGHFAGHGFHYADEDSPAYDPDDPTFWFVDDCIHPNTRGHHEIRRLFWELLQP